VRASYRTAAPRLERTGARPREISAEPRILCSKASFELMAKHRTHSLFRQGCMLYELIPNMPDIRLRPLVARFNEYINQSKTLAQTFSFV